MTTPRLIGLTGRAGSGKSTVARLLCEQQAFVEVAFAAPIKRALAAMFEFDLPPEIFDDPKWKNSLIPWLQGNSPRRLMQPIPGTAQCNHVVWLRGTSPRRLMQTLGTGWGRQMIADDMWLILAERRIAHLTARAERLHISGIVVSDVRYENEAALVRRLGGTVWHIVRAAPPVEAHDSEAGIAAQPGDRTLDNTGSTEQLEIGIDRLLHAAFALGGNACAIQPTGTRQ